MDYLLIMLVIFGIILLISLIILIVRLNFTISKIDNLLDDMTKKLNTDSISVINDRVVDINATFIASLFDKRKNKKEESEEEEF